MKNGQMSAEFVTLLGMGIIIVFTLTVVLSNYFESETREKEYVAVSDFGYSLQSELILASEVEPGYVRTIQLPDELRLVDYTISNTESYMILSYDHGQVSYKLPNITGALHKGTVSIKNINGIIYVT